MSNSWPAHFVRLILLGATIGPVWAQSTQMDGRRLDNSLQQGSGGVNTPAAQPDYRMRNNLITGNVAGLGYFHGSVGYRAPGEFQGHASGDTLFRFQSQSLPPAGIQSLGFGAPALHSAPSLAIQQTPVDALYRGIAPTSVADLMAGGRINTNVLSSGLIVRAPAAGFPGTGLQDLRPASVDRLGVSFQSVQDGRLLDMTASPLLGVRWAAAGDQRWGTSVPTPPAVVPREGRDAVSRAALAESARLPSARIEAPSVATYQALQDRWTWTPAMALGSTLVARLESPRVDEQVSLDKQAEQLQARLFSPLGSRESAPGQDVYMDILRQVRDNTLRASGQPPAPDAARPGTSEAPPGATGLVPGSRPPGLPGAPGADPGALLQPALTDAQDRYDLSLVQQALRGPLTQEQLDQARLQRQQAMARARGLRLPSDEPPPSPEASGELPPLPGLIAPEPEPALPESLSALIASLQKPGPALTSLAASRSDLLNNLLRAAEEDLAQGRYFDAEGRYRAVLDLDPAHPLARVGQVHAQMASGMVFSATLNLRRWLEDHPELIGVRYHADLLPPPQRLEFIRKQLDEMIRSGTRSEPPLLLAYLGYQFSLPDLTRYALDVAQARSPLDPLLPLIRRIWLTAPNPQP